MKKLLYTVWFFAILVFIQACNAADRKMLGLLAEPIRRDLHLTDLQLGIVGGLGFALFYTVMGIPMGRLADRGNRVTLIAVCAGLWSVMSALCGMAQNFWQILFARVGVGFGEAGGGPACFSLVSDRYAPAQRAAPIAVLMLGVPLGTLGGAFLGGWIAELTNWRIAFIATGLPGLLLAFLAIMTLKEPTRGQFDKTPLATKAPKLTEILSVLLKKRAFIHLICASSLMSVVFYGVGAFTAVFLVRQYHLSMAKVGLVYGLTLGLGEAFGNIIGGLLTRWATHGDRRWYGWAPAITVTLAGPLYVWALFQPSWTSFLPYFLMAYMLTYSFITPSIGANQSMVGSRMRGTSYAISSTTSGIVGSGFGVLLVGWMSDHFGRAAYGAPNYLSVCKTGLSQTISGAIRHACDHASAIGVRNSLVVCAGFCLWAAMHFILLTRTIRDDLAEDRPGA